MGHYASEIGYESARHAEGTPTGYDHREEIEAFYGNEATNVNGSCPRCGASLKWHWMDATNVLLHIRWHESNEQER